MFLIRLTTSRVILCYHILILTFNIFVVSGIRIAQMAMEAPKPVVDDLVKIPGFGLSALSAILHGGD